MPELPEVETVKRGLEKLLIGHTIVSVDFDWPKSFPNNPEDVRQFLDGAKVTGIRRRAKVLMIDLSSKYTLVIHLKMTGQIVYVSNSEVGKRFAAGHPNDSLVGSLPDRSTRVEFTLDDGAKLFFNDQRKFGWVRLYPTVEVPNIDFMKKVGPEPLEDDFSFPVFYSQLYKRKNSIVKAVLLDQTIIAGIGNIYADESLWGAKIHPETRVVDIPDTKFKKLYTEVIHVLELSIEKGGSTDRNYVNAEGKRGSYMDFARVFRKEGTPCPRCGSQIIKIRAASRGTHLCPKCQQLL